MTVNYGIKVSRPGFDVKTAQPNELSFSSGYKTLKVHSTGSGTLTDSSRTVTIPHNLGYVPVFMVHNTMSSGFGGSLFSASDHVLSPAGLSGILTDPSAGVDDDLFAYADSTNLYIKAQNNFGKAYYYASDTNDLYSNWLGGVNSLLFGNSAIFGTLDGAVRVQGVTLPKNQTVYKATLNVFFFEKGSGSGDLQYDCYGIDEDNTANFSGSDPISRSSTSAHTAAGISLPSAPGGFGINVKSSVEEILARSGWSSGNSMGFKIYNNSSPSDVWLHGVYSGYETKYNLEVLLSETIASYKYTIFLNQLE